MMSHEREEICGQQRFQSCDQKGYKNLIIIRIKELLLVVLITASDGIK